MALYLAPYVGRGTPGDRYRPRGVAEVGDWASLDLRPRRSQALLWADAPIHDLGVTKIAEAPGERLLPRFRRSRPHARTVEDLVLDLAPPVAQRADRTGRIRVYVGPIAVELTPIAGGSAALDDEEHLYRWWRQLGAPHADALWLAARRLWPIGGAAALSTDDFNRTDADPISSGGSPSGAWTDAGDNEHFTISGNTAQPSGGFGGDASAYHEGVTWPNDQYAQAKATVTGTGGGGQGIGPAVRMATGKNYYRLVVDHGASVNIDVSKRINGSETGIGNATQSWSDGDTWYLSVVGTTLTVKRNGSPVTLSASTDSSLTSGSAGMMYSSATDFSSLDDWEGGDFAGGASMTPTVGAEVFGGVAGRMDLGMAPLSAKRLGT